MLDKEITHIQGATSQNVSRFHHTTRMTHNLKLINDFQNFPFNTFGLQATKRQKVKLWIRGTTVNSEKKSHGLLLKPANFTHMAKHGYVQIKAKQNSLETETHQVWRLKYKILNLSIILSEFRVCLSSPFARIPLGKQLYKKNKDNYHVKIRREQRR